jgi:DNA-binding XRE family transcriptional regulator
MQLRGAFQLPKMQPQVGGAWGLATAPWKLQTLMLCEKEGIEMSFRDNLQHLRATRNMTQEQLAMMVGVSRQSVTKWEAERAYPEMDKLLKICQVFDCSLDELVQGDLTTREAEPDKNVPVDAGASDSIGYEERFRTRAWRMAIGVMCFVIGCGIGLIAAGLLADVMADSSVLVAVFVLLFVIAGLAIVLPEANRHVLFMKEHPFVIDFFAAEDRAKWVSVCSRGLVIGIGLIIAGVIVVLLFGNAVKTDAAGELLCGIMMVMIAVGVAFNVHAGILMDMLDVEKYNYDAICELSDSEAAELLDTFDAEKREHYLRNRRVNSLVGTACGIIMLVATIIGLLLLFVARADMFWVPWPIGGIGCGIAGIVGSFLKKQK